MTLLKSQLLRGQLLGGQAPTAELGEGGVAAFTLPDPGVCSGQRTLTVILADDSASLTSPGGHDPVSRRYDEARIAFEHIALACRCGQEFGAVVHFDQPSRSDVRPVPLAGKGYRRLRRGLRVPPGASGTSQLLPSLRRAGALAAAFDGELVELVILSDFLLMDMDTEAVFDELTAFPGSVHAMVLAARPIRQLLVRPSIEVTEVGIESERGAVARGLCASLCANRRISLTPEPLVLPTDRSMTDD